MFIIIFCNQIKSYSCFGVVFLIFICNLFNDAFSVTQDYIASNEKMTGELCIGTNVEGSSRGLI
jgi:hypothetical protein